MTLFLLGVSVAANVWLGWREGRRIYWKKHYAKKKQQKQQQNRRKW